MSKEAELPEIVDQAAQWLVANRDNPDATQQAAFVAWLRASPAHAEAYSQALRLMGTLHQTLPQPLPSVAAVVEQARVDEAGNVRPLRRTQAPAARALPSRRWLAAAAAVLPAVGLLYLWHGTRESPQLAQEPGESFSTAHGQQQVQTLADGSVLHLNTDTLLTVHYQPHARWVELKRGQAVFEVKHDPERPFRVTAGSAQVIDVGTRFDVYLQGDATVVTVVDGAVTVGPVAGGATTPVPVTAGQQERVVRGVLSGPVAVDTATVTAWLHRQISFRHGTLAQVAAEFNRYSATPIEIDTAALGELPVSGVFNVDDTDSMVAFLRSLGGVKVEITPARIRVSKT